MPSFLNGTTTLDINGNNIFSGVTFADTTELLTFFKDTLTDPAAGWTIVYDGIVPPEPLPDTEPDDPVLKVKGSDNGHDCYINLTAKVVNAATLELIIQGDVDGSGRLGDANAFISQLVKTNSAKLFITASSRSFAFVSVEKNQDSVPYYAGFPARENRDNPGMWGYGNLKWTMNNKFIAEPVLGEGDWIPLRNYYYPPGIPSTDPENSFTRSNPGCYEGTMDRNTVNLFNAYDTINDNYSSYLPHKGALGTDGQAKIGAYRLKLGQFLYNNYQHIEGEATAAVPYGDIDFAVIGIASLSPGDQAVVVTEECKADFSGKEYVRRTYVSGSSEYQGFLINEEKQDTPFS